MYEDPPVAREVLWRRLLLGAAVVACAATASSVAGGGRDASSCAPLPYDQAYVDGVRGALAQGRDAWGDAQLASPAGPTYEAARGAS